MPLGGQRNMLKSFRDAWPIFAISVLGCLLFASLFMRGCAFHDPFPNRKVPIKDVVIEASDKGEVVRITYKNGDVQTVMRKEIDRDAEMRGKVRDFVESKAGIVEPSR